MGKWESTLYLRKRRSAVAVLFFFRPADQGLEVGCKQVDPHWQLLGAVEDWQNRLNLIFAHHYQNSAHSPFSLPRMLRVSPWLARRFKIIIRTAEGG
jgi:hypothetical protein